ncbi:hypothetical protein A2U01_0097856, partial [Trifolium medium]|nr:hypothetical protein [Trifolium medium]
FMVLKSWLVLEETGKIKGMQYFCRAARGAAILWRNCRHISSFCLLVPARGAAVSARGAADLTG